MYDGNVSLSTALVPRRRRSNAEIDFDLAANFGKYPGITGRLPLARLVVKQLPASSKVCSAKLVRT